MSLKIASIGYQQNPNYSKNQADNKSFGQDKPIKYENPVNPKWEYFNAAFPSVIVSALFGSAAGLITRYGFGKTGRAPWFAALGGFLGMAVALVPSTLYHTSVNVFGKKREYDVYARKVSAEKNVAGQINADTVNGEKPLEQNIDNLLKFNIAKNGGNALVVANTR